jgi:hypothetical protein
LKIEACATYEFENIGSRDLLFERLVTFAGEPRDRGFLVDR